MKVYVVAYYYGKLMCSSPRGVFSSLQALLEKHPEAKSSLKNGSEGLHWYEMELDG